MNYNEINLVFSHVSKKNHWKSQSLFHCECLICRKVQSFQGVSRIHPVASQQRELGVSKEIKSFTTGLNRTEKVRFSNKLCCAAVPPTIHSGELETLMKAVDECMVPKYGLDKKI